MEPITRSEQYLASIIGEDVVLPIPQSRIEHYLNLIAQNGISPSSAGLISYDPDADYPDGSLGAGMKAEAAEVNDLKSAIDKVEIKSSGSGLFIKFTDGSDNPATVETSGSKVYRSTLNVLNAEANTWDKRSYGWSGLATMGTDGVLHSPGGTATANLIYNYNGKGSIKKANAVYLPAGKYTIAVYNVDTGNYVTRDMTVGIYTWPYDSDTQSSTTFNANGQSKTIEKSEPFFLTLTLKIASNGTVAGAENLLIQVERGESVTGPHICGFAEYAPASGEAEITTHKGGNCVWANGATATVSYIADTKIYVDEQADVVTAEFEARLDDVEDATAQNSTDIASLQSDTLQKQQAVGDAGKYLYIGNDGKVIPASIGIPTAEQVASVVLDWMDEHPGITMQYDALTGEVGVVNLQYPWGDVRRYGIFPDGVTSWGAYIANAVDNSSNLGLEIYWPAGYYRTQININQSNVRMRFEDGAEFAGLIHVVSTTEGVHIENITLHGTVTTYNRYGQTMAKNVWIDRLHLKADSTKDMDTGINGRGVHCYYGNDGFWCDEIVVDGLDNNSQTTNAAVSIDGPDNNPKNFHIGKIHIKDSKLHGVYITGAGHWIGEIVVDAFGGGEMLYDHVLDANNAAQQKELCGVWVNKAEDCYFGKISVNQNTLDTRNNAKYSVRIDETGISQFGTIKIDQINVRNVRGSDRGVTFGDINYSSPRCNADVGLISISADSNDNVSGYGLLTLAAESAVNVHSLFENGKGSRTDVLNNSAVSQVDLKVVS